MMREATSSVPVFEDSPARLRTAIALRDAHAVLFLSGSLAG